MKLSQQVVKISSTIIWTLCLLLITLFAYISVSSKLSPSGFSSIGNYQMMVVLSGSMNPTFDAGALLLVQKVNPKDLQIGDIITFRDSKDNKKNVTHRIVEIDASSKESKFITRGDANRTTDPSPVLANNVVGQAKFWVPHAGYVLEFTKTKKGLLLLVILPGSLLVISELRKIVKMLIEEDRRKQKMEVDKN